MWPLQNFVAEGIPGFFDNVRLYLETPHNKDAAPTQQREADLLLQN